MSDKIMISVIAALVNLILSVLIPCALKNTQEPMLVQFRKMFDQHRDMLLMSSVLVGVIVYLALMTVDVVGDDLKVGLANLASLGRRPTVEPIDTPIFAYSQ